MVAKPVMVPGPDHPISIEATDGRVVVKAAGQIIADTTAAVTLARGRLSAGVLHPAC